MFNVVKEVFDVGYEYENDKHFLYSKTFWTNLILLIFFLVSQKTQYHFNSEDVATVMSTVNLILRVFTKRGIRLK